MFEFIRKLLFHPANDRDVVGISETEMTGIAIGSANAPVDARVMGPVVEGQAATSVRQCRNLAPLDDVGPDRRCRAALLGGESRIFDDHDSDSDIYGSWSTWPRWAEDWNKEAEPRPAIIIVEHPNKQWMDYLCDEYSFEGKFLEIYADMAAITHHRLTFMGGTCSTNKTPMDEEGDLRKMFVDQGDWESWGFEIPLGHRLPADVPKAQGKASCQPTDGEHWFAVTIACYRPSPKLLIFFVETSRSDFAHNVNPFDASLHVYGQSAYPISLGGWPDGTWYRVYDHLLSAFTCGGRNGRRDNIIFNFVFAELSGFDPQKPSGHTTQRVWKGRSSIPGFDLWMSVMATRAWWDNIGYLKTRFHECRLDALSRPGGQSYQPLISLRRNITDMRNAIIRATLDLPSHASMAFLGNTTDARIPLSDMYRELQEEVSTLERELNDEIHLIIGAVTVQDAAAMKEQAERATQLTRLAAVYLPLTLVTGIFGMNIAEINDGKPKFWSCIIALAVAALSTSCFLFADYFVKRKNQASKEEEMERSVSTYKVV